MRFFSIKQLVVGMLRGTALAAPLPTAPTSRRGVSLASATQDLRETLIPRTAPAPSLPTAVQTLSVIPTSDVSLAAATQDIQDAVDAILSAYFSEEGLVPRTAAASQPTVSNTVSVPSATDVSLAAVTEELQDVVDLILPAVYTKEDAAQAVHDNLKSLQIEDDGFIYIADHDIAGSCTDGDDILGYRKLNIDQLVALLGSMLPLLLDEGAYYREIY